MGLRRYRSEDERKRLQACGAIVEISTYETKKGRKSFKSFDDMVASANHLDPLRVYVKGAMAPGLALSRSIGDAIGKKLGVCADPEFLRHPISSRDKVAIFFTDGVCEYMTNEEVLALVMKHSPDPHKAAAAVVQESCVRLPALPPDSFFPAAALSALTQTPPEGGVWVRGGVAHLYSK
jgi:hypothetical protein